jgi:hypothetical protein
MTSPPIEPGPAEDLRGIHQVIGPADVPADGADHDREERTRSALRDLGVTARELMRLDAMADRACARGDVDSLCDVAETMLAQHARFAENYRTVLVVRLRGTREQPARLGLVPGERSSW